MKESVRLYYYTDFLLVNPIKIQYNLGAQPLITLNFFHTTRLTEEKHQRAISSKMKSLEVYCITRLQCITSNGQLVLQCVAISAVTL